MSKKDGTDLEPFNEEKITQFKTEKSKMASLQRALGDARVSTEEMAPRKNNDNM